MHDSTQPHRHGWTPVPMSAFGTMPARHLAAYFTIIAHADRYGRATLSYDELAQLSGMSVSSVRRSIEGLIESGEITRVQRRTDDGGYLANAYQIVWDGPVGVSR